MKSQNPQIKIVAVEPAESSVLSGGAAGPHKIQGIGAGFVPEILNAAICDEIIPISSDDAYAECRALCRKQGIFVGISSGAAALAARRIALRPESAGKIVVALLPDSGERYLSLPDFC